MVFGLGKNPEKLEAKALQYEQKGKTAKAIKNREKAARLRQQGYGTSGHVGTGASVPLGTGVGHGLGTGLGTGLGGGAALRPGTTVTTTTTSQVPARVARTPAMYETNASKWEQRGNWNKAQKNREKVWRVQNPHYGPEVAAPQFYNNGSFLGYNVPLGTPGVSGVTSGIGGLGLGQQGYAQPGLVQQGYAQPGLGVGANNRLPQHKFGLFSRDPLKYEQKAQHYRAIGNEKKALRNLEKAATLRTNANAHPPRGFSDYESKALAFEQQRDWERAQRNREKAWRLRNPTFGNDILAPQFYGNNNSFLGYDIPHSRQTTAGYGLPVGGQTVTTSTVQTGYGSSLPIGGGLIGGGVPVGQGYSAGQGYSIGQPLPHHQYGLFSRDPAKYESKAQYYRSIGNEKKAIKNLEKAAKLRTNANAYPVRGYSDYESKALLYEQQGNWLAAQRNRERVWRLKNPNYGYDIAAPQFYGSNNVFLGYDIYSSTHTNVISQGTTSRVVNAPIVETHVRPVIVDQTIRSEKITEIQPVIHREVEAPHVKVIEQHIYETVPLTQPTTVTRQTIVEETVTPKIIEEVQEIIHREVPQTYVEVVEQHVHENIVRPTVTTKEVVNAGTIGVAVGSVPYGSTTTTTTFSSTLFPQHSQYKLFSREPSKYEAKAQHYRQIGNERLALKNLEKAAKLRSNGSAYPIRGFNDYESKALQYEQQRDWHRAQRNREKAWRLQNPHYGHDTVAPYFYGQNNTFSGYNVPVGTPFPSGWNQYGFGGAQPGFGGAQSGYGGVQPGFGGQSGFGYQQLPHHKFGAFSRDPAKYEAKAQHYRSTGNEKAALKQLEKAAKLRTNANAYPTRSFSDYERKALAFEQQKDWQRAQRNREKAWRVKNPHHGQNVPAPFFYGNNNNFLGYDLPLQQQLGAGVASHAGLGAPLGVGANTGVNAGLGGLGRPF